MIRCTHCTEKNQDCRFEAVTAEEKLKAQSYKNRLIRRRRQACVFWDVLPAGAVNSHQSLPPSSSPTSMLASMTIASTSAPTSPDIYQHSAAFHNSPFVPSSTSNENLNFQQYLYQRHPQTYQSLASPFDSPEALPRIPHTSYGESTINPFFQNVAAHLSSSMSPSLSSPLQQQPNGLQSFFAQGTPVRATAPALSPSFSSSSASVSSPPSTLVTPKNEYSSDYNTSLAQQQASQYRAFSAGLGLQGLFNSGSSGLDVSSSMTLLPSVMAPAPTHSKPFADADFFSPLTGEYASAAYSSAAHSTLDSAGLIRPYA